MSVRIKVFLTTFYWREKYIDILQIKGLGKESLVHKLNIYMSFIITQFQWMTVDWWYSDSAGVTAVTTTLQTDVFYRWARTSL